MYQKGSTDGGFGILLDQDAKAFSAAKSGEGELTVSWNDKSVIFKEDSIILVNCKPTFTYNMINTKISVNDSVINYEYKGVKYSLEVSGADITHKDGTIEFNGKKIILTPKRA
jgi:hypothetical protein